MDIQATAGGLKSDLSASPIRETVLEAQPDWRPFAIEEFRQYRDVFYHMVLRAIRVRYAQSALGIGWAVIQPLAMMLIFTLIFGRALGITVPDNQPYALFALCGLIPWTYFSNVFREGSTSLVSLAEVMNKVYFPRMAGPISIVTARLIDLTIGYCLLVVAFLFNGFLPTPWVILAIPAITVLMIAASLGISLLLSALAIQYRDIAYSMTFIVQFVMWATPVVYPAVRIIDKLPGVTLYIYGLNPMVAVISTLRASVFGGAFEYHWPLIIEAIIVTILLLIGGGIFFRRSERLFADVG